MSVLYATVADLESYLGDNSLDSARATLDLQVASQMFSLRANTMFVPTTVTYQTIGTGYWQLRLPYWPIISVNAVRVIGLGGTLTVTDYTRIKQTLFRLIGFGVPGMYPPDMVEVDLTHGYATVPDDVRGAVLDMAASAYRSPENTITSESIDDYSVKFSDIGGVMLTPAAEKLAALYRGTMTG